MHLLVAGPQGVVDTHVGSFLSKATKESLQVGTSVQIIGATVTLRGKEYFLARQLTVDGRTVTVRSKHGLLVREHTPARRVPRLQATPNRNPRLHSTEVPDDIPQIDSSSHQFDHDCRLGGMRQFQWTGHNDHSDVRNPQSATVGTAYASTLSATVMQGSNPVSGATVTFSAPTSKASGTFASNGTSTETDTTNSSGVATSTAFTANTVAGSADVGASVSGATSSASFILTNLAGRRIRSRRPAERRKAR